MPVRRACCTGMRPGLNRLVTRPGAPRPTWTAGGRPRADHRVPVPVLTAIETPLLIGLPVLMMLL